MPTAMAFRVRQRKARMGFEPKMEPRGRMCDCPACTNSPSGERGLGQSYGNAGTR